MTDYGQPLTFGLSVDPGANVVRETIQLARLAEAAGLDYVAVQDHPYNSDHLDTWTLLSFLAAATERISMFTDVVDLQLRPPTMLAKAAASFSRVAGGRLALGVGGGAFPEAIGGMGARPRRGPDMVTFTEGSLRVMRQALRGGMVRLHTAQHSIEGYQAGPAAPDVPLFLGSQKRRMLEVTGRASDGWISPLNIYVPPDQVPVRQQIIDNAATAAGREVTAIRRVYNVIGTIGSSSDGPGLTGSAAGWVDTLTDWVVRLGFDTFIFWPATQPREQLATFAAEVVPAVRQRVGNLRGQR